MERLTPEPKDGGWSSISSRPFTSESCHVAPQLLVSRNSMSSRIRWTLCSFRSHDFSPTMRPVTPGSLGSQCFPISQTIMIYGGHTGLSRLRVR